MNLIEFNETHQFDWDGFELLIKIYYDEIGKISFTIILESLFILNFETSTLSIF